MITLDTKELDKAIRMLGAMPGALEKAIATTLNRSIIRARGDAAKQVAKRYNVTATTARNQIGKPMLATRGRLIAMIKTHGKPRNLASFKRNLKDISPGKTKMLKVSVLKSGGLKSMPGSFLVRFKKGGHLGIAHRAGGKSQKTSYPLKVLHGPSMPQMLGTNSVGQYIEKLAKERTIKTLDHEINRILKGYGK